MSFIEYEGFIEEIGYVSPEDSPESVVWTPPQGGGSMLTTQELESLQPTGVSGFESIVGFGQELGSGLFNLGFGEGATESFEEKGIFSFFQDLQGKFMKGGIGNIAESFGVPPQVLLIGGAIAAIIVIVMVIK